jgi:hypothetical protein
MITTTHFLKKCVKVPKIDGGISDDNGISFDEVDKEISLKAKNEIIESQHQRAF